MIRIGTLTQPIVDEAKKRQEVSTQTDEKKLTEQQQAALYFSRKRNRERASS